MNEFLKKDAVTQCEVMQTDEIGTGTSNVGIRIPNISTDIANVGSATGDTETGAVDTRMGTTQIGIGSDNVRTSTIDRNNIPDSRLKMFSTDIDWNWLICSSGVPSSFGLANENFTYSKDFEHSLPCSSGSFIPSFHGPKRKICIRQCFRPSPYMTLLRKKCTYYKKMKANFHPLIEHKMRVATATNNTILMRELLTRGLSPNIYDPQGRTPLHFASCKGYTDMVRLLLEFGANPNQRDCVGNTPLHLATVTGKVSVVTLLLNAGTDVLSLVQDGYNPLHLAQTKLRLLQSCKSEDVVKIREEVQSMKDMLLTYMEKQRESQDKMALLNSSCSRLSLGQSSNEIQGDVKDLLANLDALSLTK